MARLKLYGIALAVFLALDLVWLGLISPPLYRMTIGPLLRESPNVPAAVLFYLIYIVGVSEFVIRPAGATARTRALFGRGALFGLVAYATFDLTALAVLEGWSVLITVVDLAWGALLTGSVSAVTHRLARQML